MLTLFPEEQIITKSDGDVITLTTHRVCKEDKEWGYSYNQSIMLEHVTSCENTYSSQVWLLILAGLSIIVGLVSAANHNGQGSNFFGPCIIGAIVLAVIYWFTRRSVVVIGSPSTKMRIDVTEMKTQTALAFIDKIELAINNRILNLNNSNGAK